MPRYGGMLGAGQRVGLDRGASGGDGEAVMLSVGASRGRLSRTGALGGRVGRHVPPPPFARASRLFPPLVSGSVITVIGLSLTAGRDATAHRLDERRGHRRSVDEQRQRRGRRGFAEMPSASASSDRRSWSDSGGPSPLRPAQLPAPASPRNAPATTGISCRSICSTVMVASSVPMGARASQFSRPAAQRVRKISSCSSTPGM